MMNSFHVCELVGGRAFKAGKKEGLGNEISGCPRRTEGGYVNVSPPPPALGIICLDNIQ